MANNGEITIQASNGRRRITLDPIREKVLPVAWREVESVVPCGFQQEWVSGEHEGEEFTLRVGAGVGSPWMTFSYKGHDYCVDVRTTIEELFKFADGESDAVDEQETLREQLRQAHVVIQMLNEQLALKP